MAFKINNPLRMNGGMGNPDSMMEASGGNSNQPKSNKAPTPTPKDNSRKAIRKRKTADKAAGVSKSQMRANKAKSKSEAFMAKAKASKDPSMRAQLKRKSDRLAKRAARKGGSPAKVVDPSPKPKPKAKMRTDAEIKKAYPGAVKVEGKINTWKYKGATLNPARFPVEKKGKTPKEAIELKGSSALKKVQGPGDKVKKGSAPVKKELSKMDILAKRYPGYIRKTPANDARSTRNDRPNEYHLYNPKTGDSMTVRPDFPSMNKKKKTPLKKVEGPGDKVKKDPAPKKKKVIKVTQKITPSTKKRVSANFDRFANYRDLPGYEPVSFRPDGSVTMMDKNGHTFGMKKPDPK